CASSSGPLNGPELTSKWIISTGQGQTDEPEARPTTWLFDDTPEFLLSDALYCVCVSDPNKTDACVRHGRSRSPGAAHQKEEGVKQRRISEDKGRHEQGFPAGGHDDRRRER
ncbi:hypothetical protein ACC725_35385, partial [Rhizobium ruizarguesonis]